MPALELTLRPARRRSVILLLLVVLMLAACGKPTAAPSPTALAPTVIPSPVVEPAAEPTQAPAPTVAPSPTSEPTAAPSPTPEPTPSPEPTANAEAATSGGPMPDAKADPQAALLYSSSAAVFKSATFTYDMKMTMAPADDAASQALGAAAAMLSALEMKGSGTGAMQIVDAAAGKVNMSMDFGMDVMGQQIKMQMLMVDGVAWTRAGEEGAWERAESKAAAAKSMGGMDFAGQLEAYKKATHVEWLDDTPLDDQPVQHLRFSMDSSALDISSMLADAQSGQGTPEQVQAMLADATIEGEAWLGSQDLAPRQQKMLINFSMPMPGDSELKDVKIKATMEMTMRFDKINQPVDIQAPAVD